MRRTILATAAVCAVGVFAIGHAFADEQDFDFSGFDSVQASAGVDVILRQGPFSVSAEGSEKALARLEIKKKGDTLEIGRKNGGGWSSGGKVVVTVTAPDYEAISASSGSDVEGSGLKLKNVSASVSSGADMELSGSCDSLNVSVSSGSDFDGEDLRCETVTASASSGGDADVYASRSLTGNASSGGDIEVSGKPENITKNTSSGGSVKAL